VHGMYGACDWIVDNEFGGQRGVESPNEGGGATGLCLPAGILQPLIKSEALCLPPFFQDLVFVGNYRCPLNPAAEPPFIGVGIGPLRTEEDYSHNFESDWCKFPTNPFVVDRSSFGIFATELSIVYPSTVMAASTQTCILANSPKTFERKVDLLQEPITLTSGSKPILSLANVLAANNGLPINVTTIAQLAECARLVQTAYCYQFCPPYGVDQGVVVDVLDSIKLQNVCGNTLNGVTPFFLGSIFGLGSQAEIDALAAAGVYLKLEHVFAGVQASDKFMSDMGYTRPCESVGLPYFDTCDGVCTYLKTDNDNCGSCGNDCGSDGCYNGGCD